MADTGSPTVTTTTTAPAPSTSTASVVIAITFMLFFILVFGAALVLAFYRTRNQAKLLALYAEGKGPAVVSRYDVM